MKPKYITGRDFIAFQRCPRAYYYTNIKEKTMRYQVQLFKLEKEATFHKENDALKAADDLLYKTRNETVFIRVVDTKENVVVNEYSKRL